MDNEVLHLSDLHIYLQETWNQPRVAECKWSVRCDNHGKPITFKDAYGKGVIIHSDTESNIKFYYSFLISLRNTKYYRQIEKFFQGENNSFYFFALPFAIENNAIIPADDF